MGLVETNNTTSMNFFHAEKQKQMKKGRKTVKISAHYSLFLICRKTETDEKRAKNGKNIRSLQSVLNSSFILQFKKKEKIKRKSENNCKIILC